MKNLLEKINILSEKRIEFYESNNWDNWFYKWSETYFKQIPLELQEALEENKLKNSVYLEDELWDVLWCYLSLLNWLKAEWKITSVEKVFERSYKKFTWRIEEKTWENNWVWNEVKKIQKEELKKENDLIYK
jgi:NTP pyrophosphatase (non-canonical NTP hydrolase)